MSIERVGCVMEFNLQVLRKDTSFLCVLVWKKPQTLHVTQLWRRGEGEFLFQGQIASITVKPNHYALVLYNWCLLVYYNLAAASSWLCNEMCTIVFQLSESVSC